MKVKVNVRGKDFEVEIEDLSTRPVGAVIDGERFEVWPEADQPTRVTPERKEDRLGETAAPVLGKENRVDSTAVPSGEVVVVKAPIPGVILTIKVAQGDTVNPGDELLVLEAMKMKNLISAENSGRVKKVMVSVGDSVSHNQPLFELEQTENGS